MSKTFLAGFGRVDITPEKYGPLGGYGDEPTRICNNILDHTYATCVALTDAADETILLFTLDLLKASREVSLPAQALIAAETGIPENHIVFSATHTHAAHSTGMALDPIEAYIQSLPRLLLKAAREALDDRAPASILAGKTAVERMTFVRHYLMNDGCYSGPNFGKESRASGYKAHADKADERLQLVRFVRENARDIVLVNWQCHATLTGAHNGVKRDLSADFIGTMRDHFEGLSGCHFAYFQGACGNLVPGSQLEGEALIQEHNHILYGRKMAEFAFDLMNTGLQPVETGTVSACRKMYRAEVDHSEDHLLEKAQAVKQQYSRTEDKALRLALIKENGFNSIYHVNAAIRRAGRGPYMDMEINALHAGGIAFATVPYEMFCSNGMFVKNNSPFSVTFMLTNCDGTNSYLPDAKAFSYDCYEVNVRIFSNGVAEDIADNLVDMLNLLHS